jgi:hypothetical protein
LGNAEKRGRMEKRKSMNLTYISESTETPLPPGALHVCMTMQHCSHSYCSLGNHFLRGEGIAGIVCLEYRDKYDHSLVENIGFFHIQLTGNTTKNIPGSGSS